MDRRRRRRLHGTLRGKVLSKKINHYLVCPPRWYSATPKVSKMMAVLVSLSDRVALETLATVPLHQSLRLCQMAFTTRKYRSKPACCLPLMYKVLLSRYLVSLWSLKCANLGFVVLFRRVSTVWAGRSSRSDTNKGAMTNMEHPDLASSL